MLSVKHFDLEDKLTTAARKKMVTTIGRLEEDAQKKGFQLLIKETIDGVDED